MIGKSGNESNPGWWFRGVQTVATSAVALLFLLAAISSLAQITATIHGRITDQQGMMIPDATITVSSQALGVSRTVKSDGTGAFVVVGLPAGKYVVEVSKSGFDTKRIPDVELTVNQEATTTIALSVGTVSTEVSVTDTLPLLESTTSSTGSTITPTQIESVPLNGRNYLDLMQLVPGVTVNRQVDQGTDASVPVLGQRGNNTQFMIDGMPNNDGMNGGAASQFNQDAIMEFQVLTAGYKAEFGHGSGGVINVISKSGTNDWHGLASAFYRNSHLDSSNSNLVNDGEVPFLQRWDPTLQVGGPIIKNKVFMFSALERIMESRTMNFEYPEATPQILRDIENPFDRHTLTNETRFRNRFDEQIGNHRLTEQVNLTNSHLSDFNPLSASAALPSTRKNVGSRHLMLGLTDMSTLGNQANPFLLNSYLQFREEPTRMTPSHPEAGIPLTNDNLFSSLDTGSLFGDLGQVFYGPGFDALPIHQKYWSVGTNLTRVFGKHTVKIGWDFQRTMVDGNESINYYNQLFSLQDDLLTYGPINSGVYYMAVQGSPDKSHIGLRNNYNGLFLQDDWKLAHNLTVNLGLRWDYDSTFPVTTNVSPRIGAAWEVTPKTVVRASWGRFYDHFRMGLARDIPAFGGADITKTTYLSFPRLFYGNPSILTPYFKLLVGLNVPCVSSNLSDAIISAYGVPCMIPGIPMYGIDHLNSVVAAGHDPIPAGAVVDVNNVQQLTGLTPDQFLADASAAVGQAAGYFTWDPFGHLSTTAPFAAANVPVTIDPSFTTPYTDTFHFGVQQQLTNSFALSADYYHSNIRNILGVRNTNLAFEARLPGHQGELVPGTGSTLTFGYGPWYSGFYDGVTVQISKRMSRRFQFEASYTYSKEWDNMLNSSLTSDFQTSLGASFASLAGPTDSYRGIVPLVTDPESGRTNADAGFVTSAGNPVPKAGTYYNGANLDYGPSDLSVPHMFSAHALIKLPVGFELSNIFRAQSGFAYLRGSATPPDVDGDGKYNGRDINYGRNFYRAPKFVNMDMRVAKTFSLSERFKLNAYFEMFNIFNNANPAAVWALPQTLPTQEPFGDVTQVLPGREGQVGLRITF